MEFSYIYLDILEQPSLWAISHQKQNTFQKVFVQILGKYNIETVQKRALKWDLLTSRCAEIEGVLFEDSVTECLHHTNTGHMYNVYKYVYRTGSFTSHIFLHEKYSPHQQGKKSTAIDGTVVHY